MNRNTLIDLLRPYWFRGKGRLLNKLISHRGERVASVFGCEMRLDLSEQIQRNIYLGTYEPVETAFVKKTLKQGMCFVDVGANVGYFTVLAASLVGRQGRVVAIEPSRYAVNLLDEAIEKNHLSQVKVVPVGISSKSGEAPLYFSSDDSNHTPTMVSHSEGRSQIVHIRTLDEILNELGIEQVDLLKIDIEGHEPEAFKGAMQALKSRKIKSIMCEFNDYWLKAAGSSPQELFDELRKAGFKVLSDSTEFSAGCVVNLFLSLENK